MPVDGVSPTTVVFPLLNFVIGGIKTAYEVGGVPDETTNLIKTVEQVSRELKSALLLRKQISQTAGNDVLTRLTEAIDNTEDSIRGVQGLIERARVDMSTRYGRVGARARIIWVVRDSKKVGIALTRLAISNGCLKSAVDDVVRTQISITHVTNHVHSKSQSISGSGYIHNIGVPPSYEQAINAGMHERRQLKDRRKSISRSASTYSRSEQRDRPISTLGAFVNYVRENEETLLSLEGISVAASLIDSSNEQCEIRKCYELEANEVRAPQPNVNRSTPQGFGASNIGPPERVTPPLQVSTGLTTHEPTRPSPPPPPPSRPPPSVPYPLSPASEPTTPSIQQPPIARTPTVLRPGSRTYNLSAQSLSDSKIDVRFRELRRHAHEPPAAWRAKEAVKTRKAPTLSTNSMESEVLIPGQKKPMQIRWQEPSDDEDEDIGPYPLRHDLKDIAEEDPFMKLDKPNISAPAAQRPGLTSTLSRRRPARFANKSTQHPPAPLTTQPARPSSTQFVEQHKKRMSRTEWLVHRHQDFGPSDE